MQSWFTSLSAGQSALPSLSLASLASAIPSSAATATTVSGAAPAREALRSLVASSETPSATSSSSLAQRTLENCSKPHAGALKVVVISDTHRYHWKMSIPECDILIHCGDFTSRGTKKEVEDFVDWFGKLKQCRHRVAIAGNHDMILDDEMFTLDEHSMKRLAFGMTGADYMSKEWRASTKNKLKAVCHYLDNEMIEIEGLRIWGSPWSPWISPENAWGFQCDPKKLIPLWKTIPEGVDIVVTHGPPRGYGDFTVRGDNAGCEYLLRSIERVRPLFHFFGHIHEGERITMNRDTVFINASTCDVRYKPVQPQHVFYISEDEKL